MSHPFRWRAPATVIVAATLLASAPGPPPQGVDGLEATAVILRWLPAGGEDPGEDGTGAVDGLGVGTLLETSAWVRAPEGLRGLVLTHDGELLEVRDSVQVPTASGDADPLFRLIRSFVLRAAESPQVDPLPPVSYEEVALRPVRPTGGRAVRSITPVFVWHAEPGASTYRFHLWLDDAQVQTLEAGPDTVWALPPEFALSPGAEHQWAVSPVPSPQVGPRARFQVADRSVLDQVAQELVRLRERGLDPERDGLLATAALYRSLALPYNALDALEALAALGDRKAPEVIAVRRRLRTELVPHPPS